MEELGLDKKYMPIGFFDSGVGGLSVLHEAIKLMPNENYIYFGDSKNAPYGVKTLEEVRSLTYEAVEFLIKKGAKAIVIACNTATSAAVRILREKYEDIPILGIEPAVKPAVELNTNKAIVIMATAMTLQEQKFNILLNKYRGNADIRLMPCSGLAELVETGDLESNNIKEYIKNKFREYNKDDIGVIVLGCTHYPFVKETIREVVGNDFFIIDGGAGTCRELKRRLILSNILNDSTQKGNIEIFNSLHNDSIMEICNKLLMKE